MSLNMENIFDKDFKKFIKSKDGLKYLLAISQTLGRDITFQECLTIAMYQIGGFVWIISLVVFGLRWDRVEERVGVSGGLSPQLPSSTLF